MEYRDLLRRHLEGETFDPGIMNDLHAVRCELIARVVDPTNLVLHRVSPSLTAACTQ